MSQPPPRLHRATSQRPLDRACGPRHKSARRDRLRYWTAVVPIQGNRASSSRPAPAYPSPVANRWSGAAPRSNADASSSALAFDPRPATFSTFPGSSAQPSASRIWATHWIGCAARGKRRGRRRRLLGGRQAHAARRETTTSVQALAVLETRVSSTCSKSSFAAPGGLASTARQRRVRSGHRKALFCFGSESSRDPPEATALAFRPTQQSQALSGDARIRALRKPGRLVLPTPSPRRVPMQSAGTGSGAWRF